MQKRHIRKLPVFLALIASVLLGISSQAAAHTTVDKENSTPQPASVLTDLNEIRLVFKSPLIDDGKAKISLATVREGQDIPIGETLFESPTVITASILQTPKPGQAEQDLRDFLQDKLAAFKIPSLMQISYEELPRVASGKFSKTQLRDIFVSIEQNQP